MNELQECLLEMLKEFVRVCNKNDLQYFLIGGTALGAVRHKGFIPWDDDIDVAMPRKDYEKFLKLQSEFADKYFIQSFRTDKKYILNYAKLRNSNTTYIENFYATMQINHGVWIDIFPLDGMSKKNKNPKSLAYKVRITWWNTFMMYLPALRRKIKKQTFLKDIALSFVGLLFFWLNIAHLRNKWVDWYMKRLPYEKSFLVGNLCGTNHKKEAMPLEIFGKGSIGVFEGITVSLPEQCDKYLTLLFHDYMQLPPVEKQVGHHYNKGYSLSIGYKEYIEKNKL